jgi:hypothetical protein
MKAILSILFLASIMWANAQHVSTASAAAAKNVKPEGWLKVYREGREGYIDADGVEVVPPIYDAIGAFDGVIDGMALVTKDDLLGFIDLDGNLVAAPQYEGIGVFGEYNKDWLLVIKNGYIGFIDATGLEIVTPAYTEIEKPAGETGSIIHR